MSLYNSFDKAKHFEELATPLPTAAGVLSAASRRAAALTNLSGAAMTAAQLVAVAGVTPGALTVSKAVVVDSAGVLDVLGLTHLRSPAATVGTAGTGVVAEEHGDGFWHVTKLTCTAIALGTGADDADKALGALVYTFPAGTIMVEGGSVKGIFDQASHGTVTDGEIGLGTVIASGAVSVLSGTVTFNDILVGTQGTAIMVNYVLGTTVAEVAGIGPNGQPLAILAAAAHTMHLNFGADWPNIAAAEAATFTGVVTVRWRKVS